MNGPVEGLAKSVWRALRSQARPAIVIFLILVLLTGLVYPLVVTGVGPVAFPPSGQRLADRARMGRWSAQSSSASRSATRAISGAGSRPPLPSLTMPAIPAGRTMDPTTLLCARWSRPGSMPYMPPTRTTPCPYPPTWSPPREAAWTRTSAWPAPCTNCIGWPETRNMNESIGPRADRPNTEDRQFGLLGEKNGQRPETEPGP